MNSERRTVVKRYDILAHILLLFGFAVGAVAVWRWRFEPATGMLVIILGVFFYVVWGLSYHFLRRNLTLALLLEYLLLAAIATVAGVLVFSV